MDAQGQTVEGAGHVQAAPAAHAAVGGLQPVQDVGIGDEPRDARGGEGDPGRRRGGGARRGARRWTWPRGRGAVLGEQGDGRNSTPTAVSSSTTRRVPAGSSAVSARRDAGPRRIEARPTVDPVAPVRGDSGGLPPIDGRAVLVGQAVEHR